VFFYHIGKTGGESVTQKLHFSANNLTKLATPVHEGAAKVFGRLHPENSLELPRGHAWFEQDTVWSTMESIADRMSGVTPWTDGYYWWAVEIHVFSPGLVWSFERLSRLKARVEGSGSGCRVLLTTVLREPASYFWSTYFWYDTMKQIRIPPGSAAAKQTFALSRVTADPNQLCRKLYWSPGEINCDVLTDPQHPRCTTHIDRIVEVRRPHDASV
jgi:hypothetical protein